MYVNLQLVTDNAALPVSLEIAKTHLRLPNPGDPSDQDNLIVKYIHAARRHCERITRRAFYNQAWRMTLDHFPFHDFRDGTVRPASRQDWASYAAYWKSIEIRLPRPRCVSVTSITYKDLNAQTQTLDPAAYYLDTSSEPARIIPSPGTYWPYAQVYLPGSVTIDWIAGTYGDGLSDDPSAQCPENVQVAILMIVGGFFENRESESEILLRPIPGNVLPKVVELLQDEKFMGISFGE